jgi:Cupredoxin-like domain
LKIDRTTFSNFPSPLRTACIALALQLMVAVPAFCADPELTITIKDHRFQPAEVRIPTGVKVRIILDNQGDTPEEFDSHALNREKHVAPNSRATLYIGPLEPGRYLFEGENMESPGSGALGVIEVQ